MTGSSSPFNSVAVAILLSLVVPSGRLAAFTPQLGPTLLYQDSVILQETAEHFIGAPVGMLLGPNESFLVPDMFANQVLHFDAAGRLIRVIGRQGQGPGEFARVVDVGFANDSVFAVLDVFGLDLEVFDWRTGQHIGAIAVEPRERLTVLSLVGDSVWFGGMNGEGWKAVGVMGLGELLARARRGAESAAMPLLDRVDVPGIYVMNPRMFGSLGRAVLDVGPSDFLVGFAGSSFLMRFSSGVAVDTLWLAHRARRGPPTTDFSSSQTPMGLDFVSEISVMALLSRDDNGNVITVHQEAEMDGRQLSNVRLYVVTASADGSRQCLDTVIPTSGIGTPRVRLSGSRLFVLDQRIRASSGTDPQRNVTTVVRRFTVDPLSCTGQVVFESGSGR